MKCNRFIFDFLGLHGQRARCQLMHIDIDHFSQVIIATELPDNPGASITNTAELLATQACEHLNLTFMNAYTVTWIEHYPVRPGHSAGAIIPATYDLVVFKLQAGGLERPWKFLAPTWRRMTRVEWYELGLTPPADFQETEASREQKGGA
jgi:hypothetical protein